MTALPERTRDYIGPVTDTRIWDSFALRKDDIVLSTPPKCGTTWSQAILMMLIHGVAEKDRPVWRDSLWLDCSLGDQQKAVQSLESQKHRRCIKSHTPLDGLPYHPDVTYITVYRHPVDVHFSLEKHVANMNSDILDFVYPPGPGAAFARFLTSPETSTGTDDLTLASLLHHFQSFHAWKHLPNIHFFHYADLQRDVHRAIDRYAGAAGLALDGALRGSIAAASSFSSMKDITRQNRRAESAFKDETQFFHSATSKKWQGRLSDAEFAAYQKRIAEIATAREVAWLENGSGPD